ncbi:hypothetical protein GE061_000939 [Apolygus lucorum]|uniref:HTH CENPB-type domain-containing protein n=1 Tax=Apolygus lucorum TaxID=248454 RepID=A0A8S9Y8K9_APOLU|nr:hypothetical protein GE061_000939 [Apolygus lucorum]
MFSPKKSRNALTLRDKVRLLNLDKKNAHTRQQLANMFGIGLTQVYRVVKDRENIMTLYHTNKINEEFCRVSQLRGVKMVVDVSLLEWIKRLRDRNVHVTGIMIKKTALEMSKLLGIEGFKASNGWLQGFIKRYKLSLSKYSRAGSTAPALMTTWKSRILDVINEYDASDIYALDETGLFFRAQPSHLLAYRNERCSMGEMADNRATLLLCVSMSGEKEIPLVICSCYKESSKDDAVPPAIEYQYEERSLMTTTIMRDWLIRFDRKIGQQGRKVVLFLDHAMSHQSVVLRNVTLTFVHPNFTPSWDPMAQGVFQNFKAKYRERVLKYMVDHALANEVIERPMEEIDIHTATTWICSAWDDVEEKTITNAFGKAGFPVKQDPSCDDEAAYVETEHSIAHVSRLLGILPPGTLKNYIFIDDNLAIEADTIDVIEIVKHFYNNSSTISNDVIEDESTAELNEGKPPFSTHFLASSSMLCESPLIDEGSA